MIEQLWLGILLVGLGLWTLHGNRQYAAFKQLTDSPARARFYLRWTVESFVILAGASAVTLWMLDASGALFAMPEAFRPLAAGFARPQAPDGGDGQLPFAIGAAFGLALLAGVHYLRMRRTIAAITADIEPLFPRNALERICVIPLCLNAGFSEELFFRLALPLLATQVTGSAAIGFGLAAIVFGLAHAYQGWKGILGTGLVGALFTCHYLAHGSLFALIGLHALIDLVALLIRPLIAARLVHRQPVLA
jgi:membrane protease YdiL (CAAX protease family)